MILFLIFFLLQTLSFSLYSMETASKSFFHDNGVYKLGTITITYSSSTGQCGRPYQEDFISVAEQNGCVGLTVFDGHGGDAVSKQLANGFLPAMLTTNSLSRDHIFNTFKTYDDNNFKYSSDPEIVKAGSTATAFFFDSFTGKVFLAHCGDSPGCLINLKTKEIMYQTVDHKPKSFGETERIKNSGGYVDFGRVNGSLNLTRSFGDANLEGYDEHSNTGSTGIKLIISDPEIFQAELANNPIIGIMCSDGFSGYFSGYSGGKFYESIRDILCTLIFNGRPIQTLSCDLINLMDKEKSINGIVHQVTKGTANLDNLKTAHLSSDNVSLIVFEVKKNDLKIDGDPDLEKSAKNVSLKLDDEKPLILENATQTLVINKEQKTLSDQASVSAIDIDKIVKDTSAAWDKASSDSDLGEVSAALEERSKTLSRIEDLLKTKLEERSKALSRIEDLLKTKRPSDLNKQEVTDSRERSKGVGGMQDSVGSGLDAQENTGCSGAGNKLESNGLVKGDSEKVDEKPLILENVTRTPVINKEQKTLSDQASVSAIDIDKIVKDTSAVWDKASSDDEPEKKVNNLKPNDENSPLGPFKKFLTGIKVFWNNYPKICCGIGAGLAVALLFKVLSMRGFFSRVV